MKLLDMWLLRHSILDKIDVLNKESGFAPGTQILHIPLSLERFMSLPKEYWQLELERLEIEAWIVLKNWEAEKLSPESRTVFGELLPAAMNTILKERETVCKFIQLTTL